MSVPIPVPGVPQPVPERAAAVAEFIEAPKGRSLSNFLPVPERAAAVAEFIEAPKGRAKGITL